MLKTTRLTHAGSPARVTVVFAWSGDLVENRPALSRWHPDYAEAFAAFVKAE